MSLAVLPSPDVAPGTPLTPEQAQMVADNMGLISLIVKGHSDDYEDAYQDGVFGLIRAVQKFNPAKGFTFSTYAYGWIRQSVQLGSRQRSAHGRANMTRFYERGGALMDLVPLDAPVARTATATVADLIPSDVNVEADALRGPQLADLKNELVRAAKDDTDLAVIETLAATGSVTAAARSAGLSLDKTRQRVARMRARMRHPTFRTVPKEHTVTIVEPAPASNNGHKADFPCPDCPMTFTTPQGRGAHRAQAHGYRKNPAPAIRIPDSGRPKLDTKSVRESLDDYDPWVLVVGVVTDEGMRAESVVLAGEGECRQVSALLDRIGHKSHVFRLADAR